MILFQINSNSRADMRKYLVKYFGFRDYSDSEKDRNPVRDSVFRELFESDVEKRVDFLQDLLQTISELLSTDVDSLPPLSGIAEIFNAYDDRINDKFFWDTIIALYLQLIYDNSKPVTMRDFYESNLKQHDIKYNSHTDYLKDYILDQPMGDYLNIQKHNVEAEHPRHYIMNCFPIQQYVLIHSFSKSPYFESTNSSNVTQNPFKMREFLPSLESTDFYRNSKIYSFDKAVQKNCDKGFRSRFGIYPDPKEDQMEKQLTAYIVEQTYSYEIFAQIASADSVKDSFRHLCSSDRDLFRRVSEKIENVKDIPLFEGLKPHEMLSHLPEFDKDISAYTQEIDNFLSMLVAASDIVRVSSVLTRPYIVHYLLHKKNSYKHLLRVNECGGYAFEPSGQEDEIFDLSLWYIPVVQEFYLQTLLWLFPISNANVDLIRFLKQLLIENLDQWKFSNDSVNNLDAAGKKIFSLLFEFSKNRFRRADMIRIERSLLDFNKRMKGSPNAQNDQTDQSDR